VWQYWFLFDIENVKEMNYGFIHDVCIPRDGNFFYRHFYLDIVYAEKFCQTGFMRDIADTSNLADASNSVKGEVT